MSTGNIRGIDTGLSVPPIQSIYETVTVPAYRIGTMYRNGPNTFVYGQAATTIAAGLLAASDQSVVGADNLLADASCVALAAGIVRQDQPAITAALAVGDTWIAITHASSLDNVVENSFAGGIIVLSDSGGVDQVFEVKWNSAFTSSGDSSDIIAIQLMDAILTNTTDNDTAITFAQQFGRELAVFVSGTDDNPVGAPLLSVPNNSYAWFQCWGYGMGVSVTDTAFAGARLQAKDTGQLEIRDQASALPAVAQGLANVTTAGDAMPVLWQIMR